VCLTIGELSKLLICQIIHLLFSFPRYRLTVEPLVNRVPGNCHVSFDSYEEALELYEAAKKQGNLTVIWISATDAMTYGPEKKDAIM
jgi:hypothetical protein